MGEIMKAALLKRLFRGIFSEDIGSLKKIAKIIITEERLLGHNIIADSLENICVTEKPQFSIFKAEGPANSSVFSSLPTSKRDNSQLVSYIPRDQLKHHMVLPDFVEERLLSIEKEFVAKDRLGKYNLYPKKKILLHGAPGCGKTLSAERIAWNLGLPLLKVRFDALLSSYFGESASNLRAVFDYCQLKSVVLLLDECDFISKSRLTAHDVGEVPRIVNMFLTLLEEYSAPGLAIATTNLKIKLDEALFRRFDDIIEIPIPQQLEREKLLRMTLSAIPVSLDLDFRNLAKALDGYSYANIVLTAQRAAKSSVLSGNNYVDSFHFDQAIRDGSKF
jgi:SpoVK/Ycf46/Vps4 family AAA+-type ATPase